MSDDQDIVAPTPDSEANTKARKALPLMVSPSKPKRQKSPLIKKTFHLLLLLALIYILMFMGSVIGAYTQPASVDLFMKKAGLEPGGGRGDSMLPKQVLPQAGHTVVALGKLIPNGDITTVAMPYGAGDARIQSIPVKVGQRVTLGETLALLDNRSTLQSAVKTAQANVLLKKAMLSQTRSSITVSLKEAEAAFGRARITAQMAHKNFKRQELLFSQAVISAAILDDASLRMRETQQDLEKAEATLLRYKSRDIENQPDVQVARQSVDAAQAELSRAEQDLVRSVVTAPLSGTVLDIHVRPGEKPGNSGLMDVGDTDQMTAELEVYQADIARIKAGQHVKLTSDALKTPLRGKVSTIGYFVGRQAELGNDPAANTDARVIKVTVQLDADASAQAARFTFLEVVAHIAVKAKS